MWQNPKIAFALVVEVMGIDEDIPGSIENEMACNRDGEQSGYVGGMVSGERLT